MPSPFWLNSGIAFFGLKNLYVTIVLIAVLSQEHSNRAGK